MQTFHEGKKDHHCIIGNCGLSFGQNSHLQDHIRVVHEGKKPFKCTHNECGRTFGLEKDWRSHEALKHSSSKPYKCNHCEASFPIPQAKKKHMKQCHPRENDD